VIVYNPAKEGNRERMSHEYAIALGARLRAVRRQHGMTLKQVHQRSGNRWSTVVLGSYERADRAMSVTTLRHCPRGFPLAPFGLSPPTGAQVLNPRHHNHRQ